MSEYGPMYDAIIASAPIGYWPMTSVTDVVAGVAGTLVNSPTFTGAPLNADVRNSLSTASQYGAMRIPQSGFPSMVSLELCFELAPPTEYWRGIVGVQQSTSTTSGRFVLATRNTDNQLVFASQNNVTTVVPVYTYSSLSDHPHHLYIEYIAADGITAIYVDGVVAATVAGNQLANTSTDRYITAGGYYYDGGFMQGGGYVSDLALYSRRLTTEELAARVALVGDPVPVHQTTSSPAQWGNEQSPAELAPQDPFFASVAPVQGGIRWLAGSITQPPQRDDYGYIEGTVKNSGVSVPDQRVACFDNSHNLIDEVKSGPDGAYRFDNLPRLNGDTYVVMARDSNGLLSPATADNRIPEAYS